MTVEGAIGGDKVRVSTNGGNHPRFRRDGQELFYVALDGQLMPVMIHGRKIEATTPLFKTHLLAALSQSAIDYDVTADGQRF